MVTDNSHGEDFRTRLARDCMELRRIAGRNIQRASAIAYAGDDNVAQLLIDEASVMITVAVNTERLLGVDE